jgi:hypothetical protein
MPPVVTQQLSYSNTDRLLAIFPGSGPVIYQCPANAQISKTPRTTWFVTQMRGTVVYHDVFGNIRHVLFCMEEAHKLDNSTLTLCSSGNKSD